MFGLKLQDALEDFTKNFIPHMEEEEEVGVFLYAERKDSVYIFLFRPLKIISWIKMIS